MFCQRPTHIAFGHNRERDTNQGLFQPAPSTKWVMAKASKKLWEYFKDIASSLGKKMKNMANVVYIKQSEEDYVC